MIILWGIPGDSPLMAVRDALGRLGHGAIFLDQRAVLETEIEFSVGMDLEGTLRLRNLLIDLRQISAAYVRSYSSQELPVIQRAGPGSTAWLHANALDDALLAWAELTPALVVNRPSAMATNSSKPYQAAIIQSHGFAIPETLITTDPQAVREFQSHHGTVIYKSISGIRSIVSRLTEQRMQHLEDVSWCPTQFQQYVPGKDYRVHVVGEEVFACEIVSEADDYRYATRQGPAPAIHPYELPDDIAERCISLARTFQMSVVGIDLRCTLDGSWYCFEVNPSPAFTYYQHATGQPIDTAIARLLIAGPSASHPSHTDRLSSSLSL